MSSRIILHSDMNNCYASIEQKLNPALVGKPMIVCGSRAERHGIVLAKSMEALKVRAMNDLALQEKTGAGFPSVE